MSRPEHLVRALAIMLVAFFVGLIMPTITQAEPSTAKGAANEPESFFVAQQDDSFSLQADAPPPSTHESSFQRFGFYTSSILSFASAFQTLQIDYATTNQADGLVVVDVRASLDGTRWTEWSVDHAAGEQAAFEQAARYAQYRIRLYGNTAPVGVRAIALTPVGSVDYAALDTPPVAPTFKVHATRMGMVGGRTANGHIITKRDHYVSLPSWRSLSSKGGNEYMVRITYNGRSSVAPVYDIGPWNERDDYWNEKRERFNDLPRGYPQDHAAYFDNYNKGIAEKGRVRFPTAVDVGDGVWLDDLGIKGDRAVVEVTFLWLGSDPLAEQAAPPAPTAAPEPPAPTAAPEPPAPTAAPEPPAPTAAPEPPAPTAAPEVVPTQVPVEAPTVAPTAQPTAAPPPTPAEVLVDNNAAAFKKLQAKVWYDGPNDCASGHAHWTYSTSDSKYSENVARWQPALAAEALYDVYVYVPSCPAKKARTTSAHYIIQHRDGQAEVVVDQEATGGQWVSIGRYPFAGGEASFVELRDVTNDAMQVIWYDSVKWVPVP